MQRTATAAGGLLAAVIVFGTVSQYKFYQTIVAREVKKGLKPIHSQLDELQASVEELNRQCEQLQKTLEQQKGVGRK